MHRLFLADAPQHGRVIEIAEREAHHALHVLRVRLGENVIVLDGRGTESVCVVRKAGRHSLELEVTNRKVSERLPYDVTLFQALPKGKAFENILQKATELGAFRIVPLITERVIGFGEKHDKWHWIMVDAMKQCGNPWIPLLEAPLRFADALQRAKEYDLSLVGSLHEGRRHPREWLASVHARPPRVAIWVGPEGDFTPTEIAALLNMGAKPMSLGRLVLRSDTAAISSLAIVNYELEFECIATKKSL